MIIESLKCSKTISAGSAGLSGYYFYERGLINYQRINSLNFSPNVQSYSRFQVAFQISKLGSELGSAVLQLD